MWEMHNGFGWWMVLGSVWFVFFWGLVIWAVISLVSRHAPAQEAGSPTAIEIAKRRYASGDISREEFDQLRRDLV
jgi:putative membrane protein